MVIDNPEIGSTANFRLNINSAVEFGLKNT